MRTYSNPAIFNRIYTPFQFRAFAPCTCCILKHRHSVPCWIGFWGILITGFAETGGVLCEYDGESDWGQPSSQIKQGIREPIFRPRVRRQVNLEQSILFSADALCLTWHPNKVFLALSQLISDVEKFRSDNFVGICKIIIHQLALHVCYPERLLRNF